ncbi:hypothetical protein PHLGIDRAFT_160351 [Phlebiopsis gigantea 11061_1 CR5-6]|uniref:Uncharacterized protein n=1 Tax=Phlebiopsis gigantea (strain 11061_1 CR5-6) TaxID=745531 RepID=A0A0C3SCU5_PHLG1|nr:hypothetical protein PHLGIDRAFT_160351 [Phlebiopsis gigantea 11061_1 CR5-6]
MWRKSSIQVGKRVNSLSLSGLRAEHTKVLSSTSTDSVALERSKLEVSGLQSSLAKLQEQHKEVERTNADLLRQLEKWRNMESRDTAELESLRKRKIELEVQVKQQEERVAASVHIEKERDKLHVKIQKYKVSLEEHQEALEEANKELDERENEVDALKTKVSTLEAQIKSLSTNDPFKASSSKTIFVDDDVEDDGAKSPSPPPSPPKRVPKSQLKPTIKKKADAPEDSDVQVVEAFRSPQLSPFEFGGATDDEVEEVVPPKKGKGKAPAVPEAAPAKRPRARPKKTQTAPSTEPEDDDVEHVGTVDKGKGKRKAVDSSSVIPPKKRTKKVPVSDKSDSDGVAPVKPPPKKKDPPKPKPKAKASEPILAHDADAGEVSAAPKKKKRKINIFSSSDAPPSFDFGIKSSAQGLNIPSELSPIKDGGPSMLGKALSGLGTNHRR